ncbi:UNVERIFIED_CONTAM: hypothetical protein Slati_3517300 [Sesamum latifolium]|uniref:Uncharacterized protein n=1 Tax=Sesamum latifolium TaxID=2727402 RepID=A0AAW2UIN7_9LAMI
MEQAAWILHAMAPPRVSHSVAPPPIEAPPMVSAAPIDDAARVSPIRESPPR